MCVLRTPHEQGRSEITAKEVSHAYENLCDVVLFRIPGLNCLRGMLQRKAAAAAEQLKVILHKLVEIRPNLLARITSSLLLRQCNAELLPRVAR